MVPLSDSDPTMGLPHPDWSEQQGCSHVKPQIRYRAISNEEFVLPCALPDKDATHIFNQSLLKQHQAKWFWHQKDKEPLQAITENSFNPILKGNALWFNPIRASASGIYICMIREKNPCLKMILEVQTKSEANCTDYGTNTLHLLAGTGNSIVCPGTKCYNPLKNPDVKWYKNGRKVIFQKLRSRLKYNHNEIFMIPTYDKDAGMYVCDYTLVDNSTEWTVRTMVKVEVIAKNTIHPPNFLYPNAVMILEAELGQPLELKCVVQFGFERDSLQNVTWKRDNKENTNEKLEQETSIHLNGLKGTILHHIAKLKEVTERDLRSNFTCFAQNAVGNSTAVIRLKRKQGDGKEFDAFVSYAKLDCSESESTLISEEEFALELLPDILENKYGYKLCLLERDILPGGAYTDDVVTAIRQSRRAIIILSPAYVSGPSIFELQAAVNCALEDRKIKLLLVKFQAFQEPETLPPVVKKALRILPVITWKSSISASPEKKFWKYMRYHMPVKTTKMFGNYSLKGFFQRCLAWFINSRKLIDR
ncbi:interleukin-18 receptor accessory protein [Nothoprocta perdicaria]|uniref:interleukin-18 receptor accessory protein n=1 Tax=Nothoprocta perdicaria TaxID=30464 RepID=UPI000E1BC9C6|nr:interleukin-18 receptor accessory protein [Nothoprocta perdicaria]